MTHPTNHVSLDHPHVLDLLRQVYGILVPLADLIDEGITFYTTTIAEGETPTTQTLKANIPYATKQIPLSIVITENTIELANEEDGIRLHLTRNRH